MADTNNNIEDSLLQDQETRIDTSLFKLSEKTKKQETVIEYIEDSLLIPNSTYRVQTKNEIGNILNNGEWLDLYKDQFGYTISAANYKLINNDEDPCSGMPTQAIETNRNSLALFKIPNIKVRKIDSIAIPNKIIEPNKSFSFEFNGHSYKLEANGIDPLKHQYRDTPNAFYQLILYIDNEPKEIFHQDIYNDTVTEILFLGDIDQDGKIDLILSSPRDYEEERIIIILSKDNKHYEGTRQFDC